MKRKTTIAAAVSGLGLLGAAAFADNGVNLHQIYPAMNTGYFTVESPMLSPVSEAYRRIFLELNVDFISNPLVTVGADGHRTGTVVDSFTTFNLAGGYQFNSRFGLFGEIGFSHVAYDDSVSRLEGGSGTTQLSDSRILAKWLLIPPGDDHHSFTLAVIPELILATGSTKNFTSNGSFGSGVSVSAQKEWGKLTTTGNFGYRHASNATAFSQIDWRDQLPYSLGLLYRFTDFFGVVGEFTGALALSSQDAQNLTEVFAGPRFRASRDWTFLAGAGTGHFKEDMSNDFRMLLQVKYSPLAAPKVAPVLITAAPTPNPPSNEFCPLSSIVFQKSSSLLSDQSKDQIREFAKRVMDESKAPRIRIIQIQGHANPRGNPERNETLALARTEVSKEYLVSLGVPESRLESRSFNQSTAPRGSFKTEDEKMEAWKRAEFFCIYDR